MQQLRDEHRGTIKDCKIAGATTWQGQGNHTFTTVGKTYPGTITLCKMSSPQTAV